MISEKAFNKLESNKKLTWGETYGEAMNVETEEEAHRYLEKLTDHYMKIYPGETREEAKKIILGNIGYWTGYCDSETASRVMKFFNTTHPIFGNQILQGTKTMRLADRG